MLGSPNKARHTHTHTPQGRADRFLNWSYIVILDDQARQANLQLKSLWQLVLGEFKMRVYKIE